mgnify:CR=1 FL=1
MTASPAAVCAMLCAGLLLQAGLWLGVWKYLAIRRSPDACAPEYVSIAHRAALMYAFACTVLAGLVQHTALPDAWAQAGVLAMAGSFVLAVASYVLHGALRDTDNQFRKPHRVGRMTVHSALVDAVMAAKAVVEVVASVALLGGFVAAHVG